MSLKRSKNIASIIIAISILIVGLYSGCKKAEEPTDIQFLGHKGHGSNNYNDTFMENTLSATKDGVNYFDGVEQDLQMSLDGTIWVFHNENVMGISCTPAAADTIPKMRDVDIEKIRLCHQSKSDRLYRFSEIVDYSNSIPGGFYISLDMKISFSAATWNVWGTRDTYLLKFAESLDLMLTNYKYANKMLVEIDSKYFCTVLKSKENTKAIRTCFMRYEPMDAKIDNAVKLGYDGISCNFTDPTVTKETIARAHAAGLVVQLWTPYYRDELRRAFEMNPDFIQTDNIWAKQALNVN